MFKWIIRYENEEVLEEILKTGTISYEPKFDDLRFIIMDSYLNREAIMNIKGVTECTKPRVGTLLG